MSGGVLIKSPTWQLAPGRAGSTGAVRPFHRRRSALLVIGRNSRFQKMPTPGPLSGAVWTEIRPSPPVSVSLDGPQRVTCLTSGGRPSSSGERAGAPALRIGVSVT